MANWVGDHRCCRSDATRESNKVDGQYLFSHLCGWSCGSLRLYNRRETQESANKCILRRPRRNRIDRNQNVNLPRPSARQLQLSADKNISRTAENRGLNYIYGKASDRDSVAFAALAMHSSWTIPCRRWLCRCCSMHALCHLATV